MTGESLQSDGHELITGVPSAEELEVQRSHTEDTLTVGALKAVVEGRADGIHAADLNAAHPSESSRAVRLPSSLDFAEPEPIEAPDHERVLSREEIDALRASLKNAE